MKNSIVTAFFLLLISALLYAFLIMPLYTGAKAKSKHVEYLEGLLGEGQKLHDRRDELLALKGSIDINKRELIEHAVTRHTSEDIVKFVIAFNQLLDTSALGRATPFGIGSGENQGDNIVAIPFLFNFDSINYGILLGFIETLRGWERGLRITSVRITASSNASSPSDVQAAIQTEGLFSSITDTL